MKVEVEATGVNLWMLYGIHHLRDYIIVGANAVSLSILLIVFRSYLKTESEQS